MKTTKFKEGNYIPNFFAQPLRSSHIGGYFNPA